MISDMTAIPTGNAGGALASATSAGLMLKLFELRMEPELRRARNWFSYEFHPTSTREVLAVWLAPGHLSAPYRMVTSYWDMAASLVTSGAIPAEMFNDGNTEHNAVFAKLRPYLAELRATTAYPHYLGHLERVVLAQPDAESRIGIFARYLERQRALAAEGRQRVSYPEPGEGRRDM